MSFLDLSSPTRARFTDIPSLIVLDSTSAVYGDQKYPFVVDSTDSYITKETTLDINRAITVYTRLAGKSPFPFLFITFTHA